MNLDLPPSSAFAPDPAVARPRARGPLTLTLPRNSGPLHPGHQTMSGSISTGTAVVPDGNSFHVGIPRLTETALTITF